MTKILLILLYSFCSVNGFSRIHPRSKLPTTLTRQIFSLNPPYTSSKIVLQSSFSGDNYRASDSGKEEYSSNDGRSRFHWKQNLSDFSYGANYVHSKFMRLFWKYNFQDVVIPWLLPIALLLGLSQAASPDIGYVTYEFLKYSCTSVFLVAAILGGILQLPFDGLRWVLSLSPALIVPLLNYLPSQLAIRLVQILLDLHSGMNFLGQTTVYAGVAVVIWRPLLEEIQYRFVLSRLVGKDRKHESNDSTQDTMNQEDDETSSPMVEYIPIEGNAQANYVLLEPSKSRRVFFCSLIFAMTRLGWLCAAPDSLDLASPFMQAAASPYAWTVAFMQSTMAHFSSQVFSELAPFLRRSLLLLAIQQTVSAFLITWHVFVPLYEQRGILASIGAHMAWTFGKMTWPLRILWRTLPSRALFSRISDFWQKLVKRRK